MDAGDSAYGTGVPYLCFQRIYLIERGIDKMQIKKMIHFIPHMAISIPEKYKAGKRERSTDGVMRE